MKQANAKKRLIAVAVMLLCILVSFPLGVRTALARGDDAAMKAFYDDGVYDVLTADAELAANILRSSKVIVQDMKDYSDAGKLQLAQQELETAYRRYESSLAKNDTGRDTVTKMVGAYNAFHRTVLQWLDAADAAIDAMGGEYGTYHTFAEKFRTNHNFLLYSDYNAEAGAYNLYFEEPVVKALGGLSFMGELPLLVEDAAE